MPRAMEKNCPLHTGQSRAPLRRTLEAGPIQAPENGKASVYVVLAGHPLVFKHKQQRKQQRAGRESDASSNRPSAFLP